MIKCPHCKSPVTKGKGYNYSIKSNVVYRTKTCDDCKQPFKTVESIYIDDLEVYVKRFKEEKQNALNQKQVKESN
jgi:transcriptional regulator NrdR family protein